MKQVSLRALEPEDLDVLYRIENDTCLWNVGVNNVPYSRYLLHEYIATSSGDIYKDGQVRLIIENAEKQVVGLVDMMNFDARHCRAEVGIVIQQPYRRRGYASEALRLIAHYSHHVLHLHQLYALVPKDNVASQALFSKQDYRLTGELSDWLFDGNGYQPALLYQLIC
jgi:diamine N-acetyltransferase